MKINFSLLVVSMTAVLVQAGCALPESGRGTSALDGSAALSSDLRYQRTDRKAFRRTAYAATGIGLSRLEPDTSEIANLDVNDRVEPAGQITLGADISRQLSVELHSADLGSAGFSPEGRINYHLHGGSALVYVGKNRHRYRRTGLSGFGRLGMAKLENSSVGNNVNYKQKNGVNVLVGLGAEYATRFGIGLRGEFIAYDEDINYGQLALVYRLGRKPERERISVAQAPVPEPAPVVAPVAAVKVVEKDSDNDGVLDNADQCPDSSASASVDVEGCALFSGVLQGVNFHTGSANLTDQAKFILDGVANTLSEYPSASVSVNAHTDSQGARANNQVLSEARARSVIAYLSSRGIDQQRLTPNAFGESQPIASNETVEGRRQNRRVELFADR